MKKIITYAFIFMSFLAYAQRGVITFNIEKEYDIPAEKIWDVIAGEFGDIAYSHPKIVKSSYIGSSYRAEVGAERISNFNAEGTKYLKERITSYDEDDMTFTNALYQAKSFPLNTDHTEATYKVEDLGNGRSKLVIDMQFKTVPAFVGAMVKDKFKNSMRDYMIAIQHHASTGERVTQKNFKRIKKQYSYLYVGEYTSQI